MKRGKDEEKIMEPMFPRLHVNDTEKGWPRAPPRNKMALYEQLSAPSQRHSHVLLPKNTAVNLVHPSSQGDGNNKGMFFVPQKSPRHLPEKQYNQYSELSMPPTQVEKRKKLDEDDYTVPILVHSLPTECNEYSNGIHLEKASSSGPPHLHPSSKFQKAREMSVLEHSMKQEGNRKGENSNEVVAGWKQTVSSPIHELGGDLFNSIDCLRHDDSGDSELCSESQLSSDTEKGNSSNSGKALSSDNQDTSNYLSNDTGSREDGSCRPLQTGNLERGDSVSETSIVDTFCGPDITPDDVVGIVGQKQFWEARIAILKIIIPPSEETYFFRKCLPLYIAWWVHVRVHSFESSQQRIFAIQVFELHRLIKVQKLIASSPELMLEDSAYPAEPAIKRLPGKKRHLDNAVETISNDSRKKGDSGNSSDQKVSSSESTIEKASLPSAQNGRPLPSSCRPSTGGPPPPSAVSGEPNAKTTCFSHPQAQQWLIPVMSPTEGLIYKPYPGTGFVGQACGGCSAPGPNPSTGNFLAPPYGIPAPPSQYPFPSFPPFGSHIYFSPYGMPIMAASALSVSSVEQTNPSPVLGRPSAGEAMSAASARKNWPILASSRSEEVEVQASTGSSLTERRSGGRGRIMEEKDRLPLLPTSQAISTSKAVPQREQPTWASKVNASNAGSQLARVTKVVNASNGGSQLELPVQVIKVVPRNGISASEYAARIFQSIQEERKQLDSV